MIVNEGALLSNKQVIEVDLPTPPIGGKCWVLDRKGIFILQRGPGVLRTCACTHYGTGSLRIYDGIPNDSGEFGIDADRMEPDDPAFGDMNGRPLYRSDPSLMGSWMLDAGFIHGLTVKAMGGSLNTPTIASIVWLPHRSR